MMSEQLTHSVSSTSSCKNFDSLQSKDKKFEILKSIQIELDKHKIQDALDILKNSVTVEISLNDSSIIWDLVPIICQRLRGLSEFRFKTFKLCQQMLLELCEICNPRELLILFLSELENDLNIARINAREEVEYDEENGEFDIVDMNCFKAFLKPFEKVLLSMPKKRNESLKSVLISLNEHVSRLCVSLLLNFESLDIDREKLHEDSQILALYSAVSNYVDFLETFVAEVDIHRKLPPEKICKSFDPILQRTLLLRALIRLLDYPLKYIDFSPSLLPLKKTDDNVPLAYFFSQDEISLTKISLAVIRQLACLHSNFYTLISRHDLITSPEENNENFNDIYVSQESFQSGIAVAAYLLSIQPSEKPMNFQPLVYTHSYHLFIHIPMIKTLLDNNSFFVYDKGLELLENLLLNIPQQTMNNKFFDLIRTYPIEQSLISIMIYSTDSSARKRALCLFRHLVIALDVYGRLKFLHFLLSQPNLHSGFQALVVQTYKDLLLSDEFFQKNNLHKMVRTMINATLPDDIKTNILTNNDLIFNTLNFFRFALLADKRKVNFTKIWDISQVISDNFLKPLHCILEINFDTYKLRLSKLTKLKTLEKSCKRTSSKKSSSIEVMTMHDKKLIPSPPEMTIEQEHEAILMALQNMELIESLLNRVEEIIVENS